MEAVSYRNRIKTNPVVAEKYLFRKQHKHEREIKLVQYTFSRIKDAETLLDAPCGAGRMSFLAEKAGFKTTGIDLGDAILDCAKSEKLRLNSKVNFLKEDLENLSFSDNAFEASLCFRFFHHLPSEKAKMKVISELTRVSSKYVVISYFSAFSITSIKRKFKSILNISNKQNATRLTELEDYFNKFGFVLHDHKFSMPFFHTLCIAVFKKY